VAVWEGTEQRCSISERLTAPERWLRERARLVNSWQWVALFLMAVAGTAAIALVIRGGTHLALSTWGDVAKLAGGLVPVVGAMWLVAKSAGHVVSLDSRRSARTFLEIRADPMEDLAAHFSWLLREAGRPVLLLLVDDLDRCPETFVVDLLDAVQKLMRDRKPGAGRVSMVGIGPLALWTILQTRWPMLASYLQAAPEAVRLFKLPADRIPASTPTELLPLFTDPPSELRAVMNHRDGPIDTPTIRECLGQALGPAP
jgi:hypothetical protein